MLDRLGVLYPKAACKDMGTDMWFPPVTRGMNAAILERLCMPAIRICRTCAVEQECRSFANDFNQMGIWGGRYFGDRSGEAKVGIGKE